MNTETMWTVVGIWFLGLAILVAYVLLRASWQHRQTRQGWRRTPILGQGPVRVNVRRIL
jgi:hypothetical protein